jgi:hypothetical protein
MNLIFYITALLLNAFGPQSTFLDCIKMECVCLRITSFLHHFFQFRCNFTIAVPSVAPDTLINVTYDNINICPLTHQHHLSALVAHFHPFVTVVF